MFKGDSVVFGRIIISCVVVSLLFGMAMAAVNASGQTIEISGAVKNPDGQMVPGVLVRLYRAGRCLDEARTLRDGSYNFAAPDGTAIDCIRYDHTEYHPGIVEELSGKDRQHINKLLYPTSYKLATLATANQLVVYEQIYWLEMLGEKGVPLEELQYMYAKSLRALPSPDQLIKKRYEVLSLFRIPD
jgi:hypothetical protein